MPRLETPPFAKPFMEGASDRGEKEPHVKISRDIVRQKDEKPPGVQKKVPSFRSLDVALKECEKSADEYVESKQSSDFAIWLVEWKQRLNNWMNQRKLWRRWKSNDYCHLFRVTTVMIL